MTSEELRAKARAIYARRRPDQTAPIKEDAELMVEALMDEVNALREMVRVTREAYNDARAAHARTDVPALIARVRELEEERDQALADYQDLGRVMHEECSQLESECARLKTFAAANFSAMIRQEAEQMRGYGLSYEGVRKVLHEYNDGEISFGKLMDLIRAAARAMAEDMQK